MTQASPQEIVYVGSLIIGILGFALGVKVGKSSQEKEIEKLEARLYRVNMNYHDCIRRYNLLIERLQKVRDGKQSK